MNADGNRIAGEELGRRLAQANGIIKSLGRVVVAFSAGVDSTFLVALAAQAVGPGNVLAAMGVSPSLAERERQAGRSLAEGIGVRLLEVRTAELSDPAYAGNPADRCYYCKRELFSRLGDIARDGGYAAVLSGANADDTGDFRPGLQAGRQMGVRSPLMEAGLTKLDIREASKRMGLPTWDKPAMACLASRVPYGEAITAEKLSRIERAEYALRDLGFGQCRVRDHGPLARIEVPPGVFAGLMPLRGGIVQSLKALGYTYVALDLEGFRTGSMNEVLAGLLGGRPG